ncbi:Undecaprenyl-phosphate mannosyltransferase [Rhodobacteraceae bacterium SB2]|nr:Undecaprenyl-phosphate mannosyltransferase [Rhodobacteraceae bacterium SB2]
MIYVLLPAYNEAKSLPNILPKIAVELKSVGQDSSIIICDDGSTDDTFDYLNNNKDYYNLTILRHPINRGLGETVRDLFEYAAMKCDDSDVIIRLDCDDTHEPKYFHQLAEQVNAGFDVVIASRFAKGGQQLGVSKYRTLISLAANLFMKIFFPIKGVREYSCGFRAYSGKIIKEAVSVYGGNLIQLKGLGFTCTLEKLVKLKLLGASFTEVPFILRYDQKVSDSKMISSVTTFGYFTLALFYHWPFGGWRQTYKNKIINMRAKNDNL